MEDGEQIENRFMSRYTDIPNRPLYPFGYGLSYTSFEYSDLKVEERENGNIIAHVNVKNIVIVLVMRLFNCM